MNVFSAQLNDAAQWYHDLTIGLQEASGASEPMLHVNAGLAIWLLTSLATRRWRGEWLPLAMVFIAALLNELLDWIQSGAIADDTVSDILATVAWPILITVGLRIGHRSLAKRNPPPAPVSDDMPS